MSDTTPRFPYSPGHYPPELVHYGFGCPAGTRRVRLDHLAWGKSTNLFCCFTDLDSGERFRLSVFHLDGYRPRRSAINFRDAELGSCYEITVTTTRNGLANFSEAREITQA